jgi:predicted 3-demethylubiquinone-9 3-methyltransferase (glyoxalase superfamily)
MVMSTTVTPFLMFEGQAEEAIRLYTSVFENSGIDQLDRFQGDEGPEGGVKHATFHLAGRTDRESQKALDEAFARLSDGGTVLMPLGNYPFSRRFGWTSDRFGVSWQLQLSARRWCPEGRRAGRSFRAPSEPNGR